MNKFIFITTSLIFGLYTFDQTLAIDNPSDGDTDDGTHSRVPSHSLPQKQSEEVSWDSVLRAATSAINSEAFPDALSYFDEAFQRSSSIPTEARLLAMKAAYGSKEYNRALQEFSFVENIHGLLLPLTYYLLAGQAASMLKHHERSLTYYERAFKKTQTAAPEDYYNAARAAFEIDQKQKSFEYFKTAIERKKSNVPGTWYANAGMVAQHLGYKEAAINYYVQALTLDHGLPWEVLADTATLAMELKKNEEALALYEEAFRKAGDASIPWKLYSNAAHMAFHLKEYPKAVSFYKKVFALNEQAPWNIYDQAGQACLETDDSEQAEAYLIKAISLNRNAPWQAYSNAGKALASQGKFQRAALFFKKAIEKNPSGPWNLYANAGNAYLENGKLQEALDHTNQAIRICAKPSWQLISQAGIISLQLKDFETASARFSQVIEMNPQASCDMYAYAGTAFLELRNYRKASEYFTTAIRLHPDLPSEIYGRAGLAFLCIGDPGRDHLDVAYIYLKKAIELDPNASGEVFANLGCTCKVLRKFSEAIQHFQKAISKLPPSAHASLNQQMNVCRMAQRSSLNPA